MNLWFQALEVLDYAEKQKTLKMTNTEQVIIQMTYRTHPESEDQ